MNKKLVTGVALVSTLAIAPFATVNAAGHSKAGKVEFKWSGQISRAITFADNGTDDDILFVDNNNSGTRLRLTGKTEISPGLTAGIHWETQYQSNSSSAISINEGDNGNGGFSTRKRDLWFKGGFGKVSLGQGDGAANGTSEADLSGTGIADYSGNNLDDAIQFEDGTTNSSVFSNFDGLSRNDRIRYDTPSFGPIGIAISGGQDRAELGLRYNQKLGGGSKVRARVGYVGRSDKDFKQLGVSASYITAGGFNVSAMYAEQDRDNTNVDPEAVYVKVGQKFGPHAVSVSYNTVDDRGAAGNEADRTNLSWVYNMAKGVEVFGMYQTSSINHAGVDDVDQFSVGSRIKF